MLERTLPADWTLTLVSQENFITFNHYCRRLLGPLCCPATSSRRID
jgi:hypothetical protein